MRLCMKILHGEAWLSQSPGLWQSAGTCERLEYLVRISPNWLGIAAWTLVVDLSRGLQAFKRWNNFHFSLVVPDTV